MKRNKISQKRDPEKTQGNILDQAIRCFARSGFHGVGLSEICERAGVNKRMIYHYFKDKEGLYRAAHRKGWKELEEGFLKELSRSGDALASKEGTEILLLEAVEIFHDFVASHQIFPRLLLWDGLEGGGLALKSLWKR
jgi:TetR/AcrR family transcriptional regulator